MRVTTAGKTAVVWLAASAAALAQFAPASGSPYNAGAGPVAIAVGDFDENGVPDLAVADFNGGTVTILLGLAAGGYSPGKSMNVGSEPASLVVFSRMGHASLAVANEGSNNVTVLQGKGNGTFTEISGSPFHVGLEPVAIVAISLGNTVRLATANFGDANSVTVLEPGSGSGPIFMEAAGSPYKTGLTFPSALVAADFDGDGVMDLAVANKLAGSVSIFLGRADGTFRFAGQPIPVMPATSATLPTTYPSALAVADFNGDGMPDLAVANQGGNSVMVLLGDGMGGFAAGPGSSPFPVGRLPFSMAAGYFNADLIPDLAVANAGDGTVTVLFGNGASGFNPAAYNPFTPDANGPYAVGTEPMAVLAADLNGDGKADLAAANKQSNTASVLWNRTPGITVVSAANYGPRVAVGSLVSIFGSGLAASAATATTIPAPTVLGGTAVTITYSNGAQNLLPLYYAGPSQIDAMIPAGAPGAAAVTVETATGTQSGIVTLSGAAPGLFSANGTGQGVAAAEFLTASSTAPTPAFQCGGPPGSCVAVPISVSGGGTQLELFGTGICSAGVVSVNIGTLALTGTCGSPAISLAPGVDEVSVVLPASLPTGVAAVSVSAGGVTSNMVTIYIQQGGAENSHELLRFKGPGGERHG